MGSVRLTTSDTGAALSSIDYDPWGAVERGVVARFGFTGELQQGSSVHLRARWYNTASGSFISRDSWGGDPSRSQTLNPYSYVGNSPINLTDAAGQCYPPVEFLRSAEPLNCSNVDQAVGIINNPSIGLQEKALAFAYLDAFWGSHAALIAGLALTGYGLADMTLWGFYEAGSTYLASHALIAEAAKTTAGVAAVAGITYTGYQAYQGDVDARTMLANPGVYGTATLWNDVGETVRGAFAGLPRPPLASPNGESNAARGFPPARQPTTPLGKQAMQVIQDDPDVNCWNNILRALGHHDADSMQIVEQFERIGYRRHFGNPKPDDIALFVKVVDGEALVYHAAIVDESILGEPSFMSYNLAATKEPYKLPEDPGVYTLSELFRINKGLPINDIWYFSK
ncbi:RHS repeat-associated core domain-containing protein [Chloroflexia bacterium SDU3-3]|nr:RHS repeat-associated core domain-containing protein [Chloroflexia bacterium SDU3-3]